MLETIVDSVRPTGTGDLRMVLLRVKDSNRYLSIWIGAAEADAIAAKQPDINIFAASIWLVQGTIAVS